MKKSSGKEDNNNNDNINNYYYNNIRRLARGMGLLFARGLLSLSACLSALPLLCPPFTKEFCGGGGNPQKERE